MPISPAQKKLYPPNWKAIRASILERAGHRCEQCKVPNREFVARSAAAYMLPNGDTFDALTGEPMGCVRGSEFPVQRWTDIVLTVAHLDHDPTNCSPENLRAWCQKCHLAYDLAHHMKNARATRRARKAASELPGMGT
jgi:hypothetical protein